MYQINMYLASSIRGVRRTTGCYGYILEYIDSRGEAHIVEEYAQEADVTPNQLVLMSFLAALNRVAKDSEITVYTDSLYLRGSYTRDLQTWKEHDWKTSKGEEVKNRIFWQQVSKKTVRHVVRFDPAHHHKYKNHMTAELMRKKEEKDVR